MHAGAADVLLADLRPVFDHGHERRTPNLERRSIGVGSYRLRRFRVWQRSLGDVVMGG